MGWSGDNSCLLPEAGIILIGGEIKAHGFIFDNLGESLIGGVLQSPINIQ